MTDRPVESVTPAASSNRLRRWLAGSGMVVVLAVGMVILRRTDLTHAPWLPKCLFFQATGLHCPGCGGTRAMKALASGQLALAVRNNPLLILGVPIMLALIYRQRARERVTGRAAPVIAIACFVVVVAFFIARNVPNPSSGWLAPLPVTTSAADVLEGE